MESLRKEHEIDSYPFGELFNVDFDEDGDVDILASESSKGWVWHENVGDGTFLSRDILAANVYPSMLADIDGDGDLDAVSASQDGKLAWHENRQAGDTDGNGEVSLCRLPDIVSANFGKQVDTVWSDGDFNE